MKEALLSYIAACEENIARHMLLEDVVDREACLKADYGMKADFEKLLKECV
jgi:hypothetical protein